MIRSQSVSFGRTALQKVKNMKSFFWLVLVFSLVSGCSSRSDSESDNADVIEYPDLGQALGLEVTIRAFSDANSIETGGTDVATITALVTNASNQAVVGHPVEFAASGGVLQNPSTETDATGEATVQLKLAGDYNNQNITVTVTSENAVASVLVSAAGSTIDLAGPSSVVLGDAVEVSATLTAGNQEPILNEVVTFTSAAGNVITPATATTDSNGHVSIEVSSTNGSDTITALTLDDTVVATHEFVVASDILNFITPQTDNEIEVGTVKQVVVEWTRDGAPVVGEDLRFGITAGQVISSPLVTTTADGRATIQISSNSAGPATVSVSADQDGDPATQLNIEFVATLPSAIAVNTSSSRVPTLDASTITARVTDANGNPVKNQQVDFSSLDLKGGQLNPASATTNSDGEASISFSAGSLATEFEEVEIAAEVSGNGVIGSTRLTVVERVLNVTLGTSGLLEKIAGETQYGLPFAVQVADGGGTPLESAAVSVSIRPTSYQKGYYFIAVDQNGNPKEWVRNITAVCQSEDLNGNRILDVGEDINGNGVLDPQDPALIAAHTSEIPTVEGGAISSNANGSGYFTVVYPASNSQWSEVDVTARARALGVEAEEVFHTTLPVAADRVDSLNDSPPNAVSPYGVSSTCTDEL